MREEPCKLIDARDNLDPPAHALSRRQALARFTFLTAGLALGGIQSRAFAATNPVTAGLGPSHLTTLGALDETYALAGAMGTKAIDAKSELGRLYATRSDDWRQTALLVLETLEAAPSAASFSRLTVRQRRDELLSWGNPPDKAASGDIRTLIAKLGSVRGPTPNEMIDPWPGVALPSVRYALPPAPLGPVAPLPDPQSETQQLRRLRVMAFDLMLALYFDDARGLNDFAYLPSL